MSISHITSVDLNRWNDKIISASGATGRRQNCNGALKSALCASLLTGSVIYRSSPQIKVLSLQFHLILAHKFKEVMYIPAKRKTNAKKRSNKSQFLKGNSKPEKLPRVKGR